jgi:Fe-S-cluster containining protein
MSDDKEVANDQEQCQRCGTCCRQGGPALHDQDRDLLASGMLTTVELVSVRAGEPAHDPLQDAVMPAASEFIKIRGQGGSWSCTFFESEANSCRIYRQRPLECNLLFCRDTAPLAEVIGKYLLTRKQLLAANDQVLVLINRLEEECPYQRVNELLAETISADEQIEELTSLVRRDLAIRQAFLNHLPDREKEELFLFGRPLFLVLAPYGFQLVESDGELNLKIVTPNP